MNERRLILGLFIVAFGAISLGCNTGGDTALRLNEKKVKAEELKPFTAEQVHDIQGNSMHELHYVDEVSCGECHLSTEPMPIAHATETCQLCHDQAASSAIWENHCLTCHHFTKADEAAAQDPLLLVERFCAECHNGHENGDQLYASCAHAAPEATVTFTCERCHNPHSEVASDRIALCDECHPEHKETRHLANESADCSLCHRPHHRQETGSVLCTTCHSQADDVLVHQISAHPSNCMECHPPHFVVVEGTGQCSDCHEDMAYRGGLNQPSEHKNCTSCHAADTFNFLGIEVCATCHRTEGREIGNTNIAAAHRNCLTCHQPHTWAPSRQRNCTYCHEAGAAIEHELEFHPQDCAACHQVHNPGRITSSGDCAGCHAGSQLLSTFDTNGPEMHLTCANCHDEGGFIDGEFDFVGAESSCMLCHSSALAEPELGWHEVPGSHQDCRGCHTTHSWATKPADESCELCHGDVRQSAANELHATCGNCHAPDHSLEFQGTEDSCLLCHSAVSSDAPNEMHKSCGNCHVMDHGYEFTGTESSCQLCHSDVSSAAANQLHAVCENCHAMDHTVQFRGSEASCQLCHAEPPGRHDASGHSDCMNCHTPHELSADTDLCLVCHQDKVEDHYYIPEAGFVCVHCHPFTE